MSFLVTSLSECTLVHSGPKDVDYGFHQVWYQGIVKATVSGVYEDLKF